MDGDKPSARGIAAYRSAVHNYLSSQAIEPVTFIRLGMAVKKDAYGLGKTASIKAILSQDPRFSVAESTITLSTQAHSQEQPQQARSRPNPRRPLEETLNETATEFYNYVKFKFESGGYSPRKTVDWANLEYEFVRWASQTGMRGGYAKIMNLLSRDGLVILIFATNKKNGRRYPYSRFVFEISGSRFTMPEREKSELPCAGGVVISPMPIEFALIEPYNVGSCIITVTNTSDAPRSLDLVSFIGAQGGTHGVFSLHFVDFSPPPVQLVKNKPYTLQLSFSPRFIGNSKCIVIFDIGHGLNSPVIKIARYVSANSGDPDLRERLGPHSPYVRAKPSRPTDEDFEIIAAPKVSSGGKFEVELATAKIQHNFREKSRLGEYTAWLEIGRAHV
jgi:hypothetical protein